MESLDKNVFCIIMAGGVGRRFWPLSSEEYPKQFIDLLGVGESMIHRTFRRCANICPRENIYIVTSEDYVSLMHEQIPDLDDSQILREPMRRNTAPCVAYAAAVIAKRNPDAVVFVTPSDHFIFGWTGYIADIRQVIGIARSHPWIITFGAQPTNPNTKYGYIQMGEHPSMSGIDNLYKAETFTEKPPVEVACQFIESGEFFWNVGLFVWHINVLMSAYRKYLPAIAESFFSLSGQSTPDEVHEAYSKIESISVDKGIIEKSDNVYVMKASFGWSDVETWDSLYNTCRKDGDGNAFVSGNVFAYDVRNTVVHVPQHQTVVLQGLDGYVITGRDDTLMICRRDQEERTVKFFSDFEIRKARPEESAE